MKTRTIRLPYGERHIDAMIPERYLKSVVKPREIRLLQNPELEIDRALAESIGSPRLHELAEESCSSCILVSDSTWPTPSGVIASRAVDVLNEAGMKDEEIRIVVATGLHRPYTDEELVERL